MNSRVRYLIHVLVTGLLLATSSVFAGESQSVLKQLDAIRNQHGVAAAAVVWVTADQVLINEYLGVSDWQNKRPPTQQSIYRIGSISKTFAGLLALRLQQQGLIQLDDDISQYGLQKHLKNNHSGSQITLAQLLEQTAGLADMTQAEWDHNDPEIHSLKHSFELRLGDHQTRWPPGLHASYTNVGAGLFGLALELKLKQSYEQLMHTHVLAPLGMQHSNLVLSPEVQQHLMAGYDRDGTTPIPYWHNIYRPFAAINTNNQDMIRWLQMLSKPSSTFINAQEKQRLVTPTTTLAANNGLTYGYGLGAYQWQVKGHDFWGHGGDADGYLTRFGVHPASGQAYLVMINAFNHRPLNAMVDVLEAAIIRDLDRVPYPLRLSLTEHQKTSYVGKYAPVTQRFGTLGSASQPQLSISLVDEQLMYQYRNGQKKPLYKVKDHLFRFAHHSRATVGFFEHQNRLYFQGDDGNFIKIENPIDDD